jgi:hypothetical protein
MRTSSGMAAPGAAIRRMRTAVMRTLAVRMAPSTAGAAVLFDAQRGESGGGVASSRARDPPGYPPDG